MATKKNTKSSTKKSSTSYKKTTKQIEKFAKKNPKAFSIAFISLLVIVALVVGIYFFIQSRKPSIKLNGKASMTVQLNEEYHEEGAVAKNKGKDISDQIVITYHHESKTGEVVSQIETSVETVYFVSYIINNDDVNLEAWRRVNVGTDSISINFLELGNHHTGDCTYIKAGDTDILIDAGSTKSSSTTITNFLRKEGNISDNTIEYLIVTHAHEDHISGLIGSKSDPGIFDNFTIKNIIQFSQSKNFGGSLYKEYEEKVQKEIKKEDAKLYLASDLVDKKENKFEVATNITMTILDQKYYHELDNNDENNHSVCTLFTQAEANYLFTGDLEAAGEQSLVEMNPDLPHCELFKGGHHGSYTANSDVLLNKITPDVVCICCCAGNKEYTPTKENQFPAQECINRISKHTDRVYVTTVSTDGDKGYTSMNGNIKYFSFNGTIPEMNFSNNDKKLKDTEWFKQNRTCPLSWQ